MGLARFARILRQRWRTLVRRRAEDTALDDELRFHLDELAAEKMADGLSPDEARRAAAREFGNVTLVAELSRETRRLGWLHDLAADLRFGARLLRRSPVFAGIAIASLGLGIGGSATVTAATRAVHWSPLPFPDADRLVFVRTVAPDAPDRLQGITQGEWDAWRAGSRTLEEIGVSLSSPRELGAEPGGPYGDRLPSQAFTPSLFRLLGVKPAVGRLFDDAPTPFSPQARVMVISHRLWQTRYGGAPDVVGRVVPTDGGTRTIVGVLPADFRFQAENVAFWIPLVGVPGDLAPAIGRPLVVTARLRSGVSSADAERELTGILDELTRDLPPRFQGRRVVVLPLRQYLYGWTRPLLSTLFAAAALLFGIACANVLGLQLARTTTRQREIWVRLSLGAGRARIVRQLVAEGTLLSAIGGTAGLLLSAIGVRALAAALGPPPGAPRVGDIPIDLALAGFVGAFTAIAAASLGLSAALAGVRRGARVAATAPPRAGGDAKAVRTRGVIVAVEVAFAMVLLVVAGLLGQTFAALAGRNLNFDPDGLGSFQYVIAREDFSRPAGFDGVLPVFHLSRLPGEAVGRLHERLRAVPGVEAIGGMTYQPVNSLITPRFPVWPAERPPARPDEAPMIAGSLVTPGLFEAMRTPVLFGREVTDADDAAAPGVVVVNEAAARRFFPDRNPIGERLVVAFARGAAPREVVGVVANVPIIRRVLEPEPIVYVPVRQMPAVFRGGGPNIFGLTTFVFRYAGDESAVLDALRLAAAEVDPNRPLVEPGIVRRALDARLPELAAYVGAVGAFSLVAMLLAAMGVYGVTAFVVSARTHEIGIRRALGADRRAVLAVIGGRALTLVGVGLVAGLAGATLVTPLLASQLVGVEATDPATFAQAAVLLMAAGILASLLPARRALAVEPAVVLRDE